MKNYIEDLPQQTPYNVACPMCGAGAGAWCHRAGNRLHPPHKSRVTLSRLMRRPRRTIAPVTVLSVVVAD